jgi:hypothetical protein
MICSRLGFAKVGIPGAKPLNDPASWNSLHRESQERKPPKPAAVAAGPPPVAAEAELGHALDHAGDRLALADAHRRDPVACLAPVELGQQRGGDAGAGRPEWMAE